VGGLEIKRYMLRTIIATSFLLQINYGVAQLLFCENILFTIESGTQLTIKGDVQHNSSTFIDNSGVIDLTGNWINNSGNNIFGASSGTVVMNGLNQLINGTDATLFNNLNLFNGTKTMMVDAETGGLFSAGRLNLNNAILDLNANELRIKNPGTLAITRTSGYILSEDVDNSSKVWWMSVGQQGVHTIPFGNNLGESVFFSFTMIPSTVPGGTSSSSIRVSTYQSMPDNTPFPFTPASVIHVNDLLGNDNSAHTVDRFWHIEQKCTSADYYFNYAPSENAANGNINMRAQKWNTTNLGWDAALPGQNNPTAQSVFLPAYVAQNILLMEGATWAIAMQSNPLPVELLSFNAELKNKTMVNCTWSTASEINNDYFVLLRSKNGINFEEIAVVDGAGNSNSTINYSFNDMNPYSGISYYRLKQVDFNGDYSYSQIRVINFDDIISDFNIYPNPSNGIFIINKMFEDENVYSFNVMDLSGKVIFTWQASKNKNTASIDLSNFATGIYFMEISGNNKKQVEKIQLIK